MSEDIDAILLRDGRFHLFQGGRGLFYEDWYLVRNAETGRLSLEMKGYHEFDKTMQAEVRWAFAEAAGNAPAEVWAKVEALLGAERLLAETRTL